MFDEKINKWIIDNPMDAVMFAQIVFEIVKNKKNKISDDRVECRYCQHRTPRISDREICVACRSHDHFLLDEKTGLKPEASDVG